MKDFKIAVVTGGTKGIGRQCVKTLFENDFTVVFFYNTSENLAIELETELNNKNNNKVFKIKCDISNQQDIEIAFNKIICQFNKIDLLVNNAGVSLEKMICDTTLTDWNNLFSVNVTGTFLCTKEVIKSMVKNKKGKIINISSMWGQVGASCESCYSASKGAIIAFTKACAKELAPSGINVNCIAPGVIDTEMLSSFSKADIDFLKQQTPLDKIGTVFDVANTVLFLAQPSSDFYTGQIFSPNGGFVI